MCTVLPRLTTPLLNSQMLETSSSYKVVVHISCLKALGNTWTTYEYIQLTYWRHAGLTSDKPCGTMNIYCPDL